MGLCDGNSGFLSVLKVTRHCVERLQNAVHYCIVLGKYLHSLMNVHARSSLSVFFQYDKAIVFNALATCDSVFNFLHDTDWLARSTDLKPVEYVWGAIV